MLLRWVIIRPRVRLALEALALLPAHSLTHSFTHSLIHCMQVLKCAQHQRELSRLIAAQKESVANGPLLSDAHRDCDFCIAYLLAGGKALCDSPSRSCSCSKVSLPAYNLGVEQHHNK